MATPRQGQGGGDASGQATPPGDPGPLPRAKMCWGGRHVVGLCIGVDAYQHMGTLSNAGSDAEAVSRALRRVPSCYSEAVRNPATATELLRQVRARLKEPELAQRPPRLFVVYYSGHGIQQHGKVWLVPAKFRANANVPDPDEYPEDLERECLSLNDLMEALRKLLDQPVQSQFSADKAPVFLVVLDACRVEMRKPHRTVHPELQGLDEDLALEPEAGKAPRKYKILFACSRQTVASDGRPSDKLGPFAQAMLHAEHGFFAEGVALRDAIEAVSQAVVRLNAQGGRKFGDPKVHESPGALPADFCINPRRGAGGGSGGSGGTSVGTGKRKAAEPDEGLLSLLRATGLDNEAGRLAEHGVWSVEDAEQLREEDLPRVGLKFRRLLEHIKSLQAAATAFLSKIKAFVKKSDVPGIIAGMGGHLRSADVQKEGCGALRSLAAGKADNKAKIAAAGGINAVVGAMGAHSGVADVQKEGCAVSDVLQDTHTVLPGVVEIVFTAQF